MIYIYIL